MAYYSGLLDFYIQLRDRCPAQNRLFILSYHTVVENVPESVDRGMMPPQLISKGLFEKQVDEIARQFDFLPIDRGIDFLEGKGTLKRDSVVLTFDDGYQGVYDHAYPILKRKGIPAIIYVCTDYVGTPRIFNHDRLFHLIRKMVLKRIPLESILQKELQPHENGIWKEPELLSLEAKPLALTRFLLEGLPPDRIDRLIEELAERLSPLPDFPEEARILSWEAISEMHRNGMTFGSHTSSHCLLTTVDPNVALEELRASKEHLEKRLGGRVDHLAYPDGRYNFSVVEAARACGYRSACTTADFVNKVGGNLHLLGRQLFWENSTWGWASKCSKAMVASQIKGLFRRGRGHDVYSWNHNDEVERGFSERRYRFDKGKKEKEKVG